MSVALRLARDEDGIALVLALGIMLALTISLTTVVFFSTANALDAQRINSGQRAYSLAEAGINDGMSVLKAYYANPANFYPGDQCLLRPQAAPTTYQGYDASSAATSCGTNGTPYQAALGGGSCTGTVNSCTTWSGALQHVTGMDWDYQWVLRSTGTMRNPTGPNLENITRTDTVVVPLIPGNSKVGTQSALDWVYGQTLTFSQSVQVDSPVFAAGDLVLANTSVICGAAGKVEVGGNVALNNPQNQIGKVSSCPGSDPKISEIHAAGTCKWQNKPSHSPCSAADNVNANTSDTSFDSSLAATLAASFPDSTAGQSVARPGPNHNCNSNLPSGTYPWQVAGDSFNFSGSPLNPNPIDLTPNASYSCVFQVSGQTIGELSWDNTNKLLSVVGTIYLPGTATVSQNAHYEGVALLFLTGGFYMDANGETLCAVMSGSNCNLAANAWNPNSADLVIYALGTSSQYGNGIELKNKVQYQGALMSNYDIYSDTNAIAEGPMDSKNGQVNAGESNTLTYPAIHLIPGGVNPSQAPGVLLSPRNFAGG